MGYTLTGSYDTVQVLSATSAVDVIYCTIVTDGSGSIVQEAIPKTEFAANQGAGELNTLADAVDGAISGGLATFAVGTQGIDASGLIYDAVTFTVQYVPSRPTIAPVTTTVEIPVGVLTLDVGIALHITGGNTTERLQAAYDQLKTLAGE